MKKIIIKIPDKCGSKCICFEKIKTDRNKEYHICKAFDKILTFVIDGFGNVVATERCDECQRAINDLKRDGEVSDMKQKIYYRGEQDND